jgi:hypothetical protein
MYSLSCVKLRKSSHITIILLLLCACAVGFTGLRCPLQCQQGLHKRRQWVHYRRYQLSNQRHKAKARSPELHVQTVHTLLVLVPTSTVHWVCMEHSISKSHYLGMRSVPEPDSAEFCCSVGRHSLTLFFATNGLQILQQAQKKKVYFL